MDDAFLVRRLERLGNLPRNRERLSDCESGPPGRDMSAAALTRTVNLCLQRLAADPLEHQRRNAVEVLHAVNRADGWMAERGEHASFALEAHQRLVIPAQARRQYLDGDVAPQLRVVRTVYDAHAAGADRFQDFVWTKAAPNQL